jgi:hypothetical protein
MKNRIRFGALRRLLLDIGFREFSDSQQIVFRHETSDTTFVFRAYRVNDPVTSYNVLEVKDMLASRGLMSADAFEDEFSKAPA